MFRLNSIQPCRTSMFSVEFFYSRCASTVGGQGGKQIISLPQNCALSAGRVQHEILHGLGMFHEQSRPDRDDYVILFPDNIIRYSQQNFNRLPLIKTYDTVYDITSVMHYGFNDFAVNPDFPTILPTKNNASARVGQRVEMTVLDAVKQATSGV